MTVVYRPGLWRTYGTGRRPAEGWVVFWRRRVIEVCGDWIVARMVNHYGGIEL